MTAALGTHRIPEPRLVVLPATSVWLPGPGGDPRRRALMGVYRNVTRLLETGADAYLTKPLDVPRFLEIVDSLLTTR